MMHTLFAADGNGYACEYPILISAAGIKKPASAVPADGNDAANCGNGDFGVSPFYGQLAKALNCASLRSNAHS